MDIDIKAVQQRELEILKVVAEICERNGLRYFITYGTLLGAVRHKGFIPWDDDMDIGMPRKDFDKFRAIAPTALPEHLIMRDFEQTPSMCLLFMKVIDTRTTNIERELLKYPDMHSGVYIDILPYDGYPSDPEEQRKLRKRYEFLRYFNKVLRMRRPSPPFLRAKEAVLPLIRRLFPYNWASQQVEKLMRRYDADTSEWVQTQMWRAIPGHCIRELTELPFEDMMLPGPADYDTPLKIAYGDYMTPPPVEKRNGGHNIAYRSLDKSYLDRWWEKENG